MTSTSIPSVIIPGLYGLDTATAWKVLQKDPTKYMNNFLKGNKNVQGDIDYFTKNASKITSVDALMKDRRMLKIVLESYGLGTEIDNAGRIKKILSEDPTKTDALVNKLSDPKFKALATGLRLDLGTGSRLSLKVTKDIIVSGYKQNEFEDALGEQDNSLREAAYFARKANSISDAYSILGDKVLIDVAENTLNIPQQLAVQPIESQAAYLAKKIDTTKFANTTSSSVSATQLAQAKSDSTLLDGDLAISDAASKQLGTLQSQINTLISGYENLDANTDPAGDNAALIAQQQTAVPELVRYSELLRGGNSAVASVQTKITSLLGLISQAGKSGADISDLKNQFNTLVTSINASFNGAAITAPDGTTQNILLNGSADTQSVAIDDKGTTVTINRYDATSLQATLTDAQTAFNAITDSSDSNDIITANAKLANLQARTTTIGNQIAADQSAYSTAVSNTSFYATLNTVDLTKGQDSVADALSRITSINTILGQIGTLANQSTALSDSADHTDITNQFNAYKTQIRDLIGNVGDASLDNLLNNSPDKSYEIINGQTIPVKGGYDLLSTISDVLDGQDISTQSGAAALSTKSVQLTVQTERATNGLNASKPYLDLALDAFDPKANLDVQVQQLQSNLASFISGAASNGKNLLSPSQSTINLSLSTGTTLKFTAQISFQADFTTKIANAVAQLGNGSATVAAALDDVYHTVTNTKHAIDSDNRIATIESGKLAGTIDVLDAKNAASATASASNPYATNAFTAKFLTRYLTQISINNSTSGATNYLTTLFGSIASGSSSSSDSSSSISTLIGLSVHA